MHDVLFLSYEENFKLKSLGQFEPNLTKYSIFNPLQKGLVILLVV